MTFRQWTGVRSIYEALARSGQSLTAYKVPRVVKFVDALPKAAVGKILRRHLRDT